MNMGMKATTRERSSGVIFLLVNRVARMAIAPTTDRPTMMSARLPALITPLSASTSTATTVATPTPAQAGYFERGSGSRSEEHTSELQSRGQLVCRLLLE